MKFIKRLPVWVLAFVFSVVLLGEPAKAQTCVDIFNRVDLVSRLSDESLTGLDGRTFKIHNREFTNVLRPGLSRETVTEYARMLVLEKTTLEVPIDAFGNLAAANVGAHGGGYGLYTWFRDAARIAEGLASYVTLVERVQKHLPANSPQQPALAIKRTEALAKIKLVYNSGIIALVSNPQWTKSAIANIENPALHLAPDGQRLVIWIRRVLEPFQQKREPTELEMAIEGNWGHKQNDGLAAIAESVLNGMRSGLIDAATLPREARVNILLLSSYFMRLRYWDMWDVGAWEEGAGLRTSSISQVNDFIKRFEAGYYSKAEPRTQEDAFFRDLRERSVELLEGVASPEVRAIVLESIKPESLESGIREATKLIEERLASERPVEATIENGAISRFEDTALIHILWPHMIQFSPESQVRLLNQVQTLERPSGYARYAHDWFLHGGAMGAIHREALGITNTLAVKDGNGGWRVATEQEVARIIQVHNEQVNSKDMTEIVNKMGTSLEAQWTLPDSYLTRIYGDLYLQTREQKYKDLAGYHFMRVTGQITGKNEFSVEGTPVAEGKIPEAYIPIPTIKNGQLEIVYAVSPNSPLNWATAEYIIALNKILEIY